jgi:hypothetical protein
MVMISVTLQFTSVRLDVSPTMIVMTRLRRLCVTPREYKGCVWNALRIVIVVLHKSYVQTPNALRTRMKMVFLMSYNVPMASLVTMTSRMQVSPMREPLTPGEMVGAQTAGAEVALVWLEAAVAA